MLLTLLPTVLSRGTSACRIIFYLFGPTGDNYRNEMSLRSSIAMLSASDSSDIV